MTIIRLIFAAALASFAVANVDEVSNDGETFAEATAFVQSFSSMHVEGDSACLKVADDAIKVIADECKALQGVIDNASKANQKCCQSGSVAACKAKNQHASSVGAHSTCLSQLDTIKKKTVNLGSVSYSSLAGKTCEGEVADHTKNSAFKAIKSEVEKKTKECYEKKGLKNAAKKTYEDAVKTAASSRTTCNANGQTALTKAFTDGKAACGSATNQKAFTRAEHMKCVLKGTNLADCSKNMPKPPGVKKTTLSVLNCAAQNGDSSQCQRLSHCKNANHGKDANGFWVKRSSGNGAWNSGCIIQNAAASAGTEYTMYARWDPYGGHAGGNVHAMWGFDHKKSAEASSRKYQTIDFAFYCHATQAAAYIYENGSHKKSTPCTCGSTNGQTQTWITIQKNGQVKYYMQSNMSGMHHKKLCYTSSTKATNFPYVADMSLYGGTAKMWAMKVTSK